jgi:multidrug efflux pump subunit AcrA (membrane-fusion protein)
VATPGRALVTLYREDALRFQAAVPAARAAGLAPGAELALEIDGEPVPARLERILPGADPRTGTVTLRLDLEAASGLEPGRLGRLSLAGGTREALVVPAGAVERIGQVERVELVRGGGVVPVTVRTGRTRDGLVEVLSGLAEGEEVRLR